MNTKPIPRGEFKDIQSALMRAGMPEDPCGRCGCRRKDHFPTPTFSFAKSGGSSGKSHELPCLAPTCCVCHFCFCFCVAFVEPFAGQKYMQCIYEHEPGVQRPALEQELAGEVIAYTVYNHEEQTVRVEAAKPKRTKKPNDEPRLFA